MDLQGSGRAAIACSVASFVLLQETIQPCGKGMFLSVLEGSFSPLIVVRCSAPAVPRVVSLGWSLSNGKWRNYPRSCEGVQRLTTGISYEGLENRLIKTSGIVEPWN
jgi:hypothetical protein